MCQGTCGLDLEDSHESDSITHDPRHGHREPEGRRQKLIHILQYDLHRCAVSYDPYEPGKLQWKCSKPGIIVHKKVSISKVYQKCFQSYLRFEEEYEREEEDGRVEVVVVE